ncbi:hormogonium polysaccharide biosynthesis glycosyltransferase HpsE [Laspinema olomoucense]|uniref:Hormogonium polysaccharide biosynthesis glycosyltransferase HpsE n=1 Tax=Laspinema olomoucense D3b TaxID=2953688 RepID=A0ABT2NCI7_9CYAN|nr:MULTISPECIES: hormogonium polysaccharide biosynthesis glycosyltransferase HpsE [unclassified Laspinema]MCT7970474.1 hormogonium polysaccharide biosynthesis glycosyltransferase HpsE [Laspinema sp. D3d]MCT7980282.1 hormogonium polysaccharide biosynthesis glycosyltransferase HpsE [Laspinema sp. D3b]MCT7988528.1 hormogonium polysaccharide biosynthesis glycosyltransferase HpsE [Laspinema sp. D3a]MCT7993939.1 hormogonium polysaccharide biosynthesis glycosyltransferase HpsE [Laspinema sp. D3c]
MGIDLTVVICTYNGEKRFPEVLEALRGQINTEDFSWEILVVDNNSTDNTPQILQDYQAKWDAIAPLRYCRELEQGAAHARKRAVKEVKSPLIGFLDDDTIPASNWVSAAYQFAQEHPQAGAVGSYIQGEFEIEPPPNFKRLKPFLAITQRGSKPLLYRRDKNLLPPSAGLLVRTQAWQESVPEHCILSGRTPGSMLTGEDLEALAYIKKKWEIWYNPTMQLTHKIPRGRLEMEYLIPFFRGIGLSRYVTRMVGVQPILRPVFIGAYFANDLRKLIRHVLKYGIPANDAIAACERELLLGSLNSFFYLWRYGYLKPATKITPVK